MEREHIVILRDFLKRLTSSNITRILDAGSGKTSLSEISACFPDAQIDAVVYPGDERKLSTIRPMETRRLSVLELDLYKAEFPCAYDLVVAHLLLGEASKFEHTYRTLLERLVSIPAQYFIIIDYLEDPDVDETAIEPLCKARKFSVLKKLAPKTQTPKYGQGSPARTLLATCCNVIPKSVFVRRKQYGFRGNFLVIDSFFQRMILAIRKNLAYAESI